MIIFLLKFTNNHILNNNKIEIGKEIEFEYLKNIKKIKITKNRKVFTNEKLDYTCIEIFNTDEINKFFRVDETIFFNKDCIKNKEIFILQYPYGEKLCYGLGRILDIKDNLIIHSASTLEGSSGSPLIKRYNNNIIFGIHLGGDKIKKYNFATPFDNIIIDIKYQLSHNKINLINNNNTIEYRNRINLIYYKNSSESLKDNNNDSNRIFGEIFVKYNKDNIKLIINNNPSELISEFNLKEGENIIQLILINKLTSLSNMFNGCKSLKNIEELKYLNTQEVNDVYYMFGKCSSLSDLNGLQNWNTSNIKDFYCMFNGCLSLSNIKALQNWNVSNAESFSWMFAGCSSLPNLNGLQNWNVSNGKYFNSMFEGCSSLSDIKALKNWNVSNGIKFSGMFNSCESLSNLNGLQNWNVSNANKFTCLFHSCTSLSDISVYKIGMFQMYINLVGCLLFVHHYQAYMVYKNGMFQMEKNF